MLWFRSAAGVKDFYILLFIFLEVVLLTLPVMSLSGCHPPSGLVTAGLPPLGCGFCGGIPSRAATVLKARGSGVLPRAPKSRVCLGVSRGGCGT